MSYKPYLTHVPWYRPALYTAYTGSKTMSLTNRFRRNTKRYISRRRRYKNLRRRRAPFPELKVSDLYYNLTYDFGDHVFSLTDIDQGITTNTRVGREVNIRSVLLRLRFTNAANVTNQFRYIIFRWMNDGTPIWTDILDQVATVAQAFVSPLNLDNSKFIKVWKDKIVNLNDEYANNTVYRYKKHYSKKGFKIKYTDSGSQGSDYNFGNLFMLVFSEVTENPPSIAWHCRVRYVDN